MYDKSNKYFESINLRCPNIIQKKVKGIPYNINAPRVFLRGKGCKIYDVDGNEFIDTSAANGALLLGYSDDYVDEEVFNAIKNGVLLPQVSEYLYYAIFDLEKLFPQYGFRFFKTGSSANMAAIRMARANSNKEKIIICAYHGWQDTFMPHRAGFLKYGVPKAYSDLSIYIKYGDVDTLKDVVNSNYEEIAAIVSTPWEGGIYDDMWLQRYSLLLNLIASMLKPTI